MGKRKKKKPQKLWYCKINTRDPIHNLDLDPNANQQPCSKLRCKLTELAIWYRDILYHMRTFFIWDIFYMVTKYKRNNVNMVKNLLQKLPLKNN
jgi:hypothetical protein